jgi:hypothetical protein
MLAIRTPESAASGCNGSARLGQGSFDVAMERRRTLGVLPERHRARAPLGSTNSLANRGTCLRLSKAPHHGPSATLG